MLHCKEYTVALSCSLVTWGSGVWLTEIFHLTGQGGSTRKVSSFGKVPIFCTSSFFYQIPK
jgi:hypothetical protein